MLLHGISAGGGDQAWYARAAPVTDLPTAAANRRRGRIARRRGPARPARAAPPIMAASADRPPPARSASAQCPAASPPSASNARCSRPARPATLAAPAGRRDPDGLVHLLQGQHRHPATRAPRQPRRGPHRPRSAGGVNPDRAGARPTAAAAARPAAERPFDRPRHTPGSFFLPCLPPGMSCRGAPHSRQLAAHAALRALPLPACRTRTGTA